MSENNSELKQKLLDQEHSDNQYSQFRENNQLSLQQKQDPSTVNISNITKISNNKNTVSSKFKFYDPFESPPDIQKAQQHLKAKRVGKLNNKTWRASYHDNKLCCQCCFLPINKEQFPLSSDTNDFTQLGLGISIYFDFVKYLLGNVLIVLGISGIYSYIKQIQYCLQMTEASKNGTDYCLTMIGIIYSYKGDRITNTTYASLDLTSIIISIIYLLIIQILIERKNNDYYQDKNLPSRYTLMINNIDNKLYKNEQQLKDLIAKYAHIDQSEIIKINFTYKIDQYIKNLLQKSKLVQKQQDLVQNVDFAENKDQSKLGEKLNQYTQQINQLEDQIFNYENVIQNIDECIKLRNKQAFVTFNSIKSQQLCKKAFSLTKWQKLKNYFQNQKKLHMSKAPEPLDIIWENLEYDLQEKFYLQIRGLGFDLLMIFGSFGIVALLTWIQTKHFKVDVDGDFDLVHNANLWYSFIITLTIATINIVLAMINETLILKEKGYSYTQQTQSNAWTLSWMDFTTMGLVPSLLLLIYGSQYDITYMLHNTLLIFGGNTFVVPSMILVNFPYIISRLRQKKLIKNINNCNLTQQQAHKIFEDPTFMLDRKYCVVNSSYLFSMYYSSLFPFALLFGAIVQIYFYWVSKYNLVKKSQLPNSVSENLHKQMMYVISFGPFFYALGTFLNGYQVKEVEYTMEIKTFQYIGLVFSSLYVIFRRKIVSSDLIQKTFFSHKKTKKRTYEKAKKYFGIDYETANPILIQEQQNESLNINKNGESLHSEAQTASILNNVEKPEDISQIPEIRPKVQSEKSEQKRKQKISTSINLNHIREYAYIKVANTQNEKSKHNIVPKKTPKKMSYGSESVYLEKQQNSILDSQFKGNQSSHLNFQKHEFSDEKKGFTSFNGNRTQSFAFQKPNHQEHLQNLFQKYQPNQSPSLLIQNKTLNFDNEDTLTNNLDTIEQQDENLNRSSGNIDLTEENKDQYDIDNIQQQTQQNQSFESLAFLNINYKNSLSKMSYLYPDQINEENLIESQESLDDYQNNSSDNKIQNLENTRNSTIH